VLTYTLSILVNKCVALVVMGAGVVITGHAVLTPLLQALSMLAGDLVTMSRAADHARPTPYPNHWQVRNLTLAAVPLGMFKLAYCLSILSAAWFLVGLDPGQMRTLTFLMLILAGQANTFILRERGHFWHSHPARIMVLASVTDVAIVTSLAVVGLLMAPLPLAIAGGLFVTTVGFSFALDAVKVGVLRRLRID
jgi:H+-transporting ATPase